MTTAHANAHADALIREIEDEGAKERRAIAEAAEREAGAIVRRALADVRRRVHDEIVALRRDRARRLARAAAQIETERRLRDQARTAEILHTGYPDLIHLVVERWTQKKPRQFWIASMAAAARKRLPPSVWSVEHPHEWTAEDEAQLRAALPAEAELTFRATDEFDAGFRILADGATLDCTPERLLAEKSVIQARLLAEMSAEVDKPGFAAHGAVLVREGLR
ncbi:MAG TPA: hypothetical protein VJY34_24340 [Roseiarcus sp.]|nr:hypothetical protein [Roseiarcus sp.]